MKNLILYLLQVVEYITNILLSNIKYMKSKILINEFLKITVIRYSESGRYLELYLSNEFY